MASVKKVKIISSNSLDEVQKELEAVIQHKTKYEIYVLAPNDAKLYNVMLIYDDYVSPSYNAWEYGLEEV